MINNSTRRDNKVVSSMLIVLMVFSPYTALRFFSILGIPEISFLFLIIYTLYKCFDSTFILSRSHNFIFTRFWISFLLLTILGIATNYFFFRPPSGKFSSLIFDFSTYLFLAIGLFALELLTIEYKIDYSSVLFSIFLYSSTFLVFLYIISRITPSIFGFQLKQGLLFRPFATNIHHVSMVIGPLPFIGLFCLRYSTSNKIFLKVLITILILACIMISLETGSFKVYLGVILGFIILAYSLMIKALRDIKSRVLVSMLLIVCFIFFISLNLHRITFFLIQAFREEDLSSAREIIYSYSFMKVLASPFFGYGPGAHARFSYSGYSDAHQTLLTLLLQAGPFALVVYLILWFKIIYSIKSNPYLLAASIPILIYALGGDILRRLPMWIYLFLLYKISMTRSRN